MAEQSVNADRFFLARQFSIQKQQLKADQYMRLIDKKVKNYDGVVVVVSVLFSVIYPKAVFAVCLVRCGYGICSINRSTFCLESFDSFLRSSCTTLSL